MTRTSSSARRPAILAGFGIAIALLAGCEIDIDASFGEEVQGSGNMTTEIHRLDDFDGLEICCGLDVVLEVDTGPEESVEITIDDNLHELLDVEVVDGTLVVKPERHTNLHYDGKLVLRLSGVRISRLDIETGSRVEGEIPPVDEVVVRSATGSESKLIIDGDVVIVEAETGASVELSGRADRLEATASTGSRIDLTNLDVLDVTSEAETGSSVQLEASTTNSDE